MCNEEITIRIEEVKPVEIGVKLDISYAEDPNLVSQLDELNGEVVGVTSSAKIAAAMDSKEAIKETVNAKGGSITDDTTFSEYAHAVAMLPEPAVVGTPADGLRVRFFDYDGTLLKTQYVAKGTAATAPIIPEHEGLVFSMWNNEFSNVQHQIDTGAMYTAQNGGMPVIFNISTISNTVYLQHTVTGGTSYIDWGDGSPIEENTDSFTSAHTYAPGRYVASISVTEGATIRLLKQFASTSVASERANIGGISLTDFCTAEWSAFLNYSMISTLIMPPGKLISTAGAACKSIIASEGVSTFSYIAYNCSGIQEVYFPSTATSIQNAFESANVLQNIYILAPTVVSIDARSLNQGNPRNVYVRKGFGEAYKSATNWSVFADVIEEMEE